jgi:hypothetical protein
VRALEEKRRLAARLVELSPQPFSPRVYPEGALRQLEDFFELLRQRQKMILVETYVEHLTCEELAELVRFYESESGRSLVKTWSILDEKMRRVFPSLARETAKDAGFSGDDIGGVLRSYRDSPDND